MNASSFFILYKTCVKAVKSSGIGFPPLRRKDRVRTQEYACVLECGGNDAAFLTAIPPGPSPRPLQDDKNGPIAAPSPQGEGRGEGEPFRSVQHCYFLWFLKSSNMPVQLFWQRSVYPLFLAVILTMAMGATAEAKVLYSFNFGGHALPDAISISPTNIYSSNIGYGFEPGAVVSAGDGCIGSTNPFYFSVKLPEGNYRVTVILGDATAPSTTTIKAELRRLMLYHLQTAPGMFVTRSFIVNLRQPEIPDGSNVHLKPREKTDEWWDWDDKLTLELNDAHPCIRALTIENADVPTVFLLGDSTVCDQPFEPWNSWGQMLPFFFKPEIAVANHSESGETIADSLAGNRFKKVFSLMKPGDYLFIQFGHNDMKNKKLDALDQYKADFKKVIAETRAKDGTPVLVTSMERKAGIEHPTLEGYPDAVREVAKQENCALIDLNAMSLVFYKALGTNLDKAFVDGTHHDSYGSCELAQCVVDGIRQNHLPLAKYIVSDFRGFDPAHPYPLNAFYMPASPKQTAVKPLGN
jgi:lysophospholipase L1-like esterase